MAKRKACFIVVCGVMVLASVLFASYGESSPTSGATCGNTQGVNGTGQIIVATSQNTPLTGSDGTQISVYNPNTAYGPVPSCIQDWIPDGCTDQGTVFDETGEHEVQGTLPWVPYFQAAMGQPQFNGFAVQTLRCGKTWRFLAWDDASSHSYHEVSPPGRTDCPNGEVRYTYAPLLTKDPYGSPMFAMLEERGSGNDWVASQVSMPQTVDEGSDLYPPHCPPDN
jgi:hypothetical protein